MTTARGAILITGASSGMGEACALRLARAGYTVFAGVRKDADAQRLRQQEPSPRLVPVIIDVAKEDTIAAAMQTMRAAVGSAGLVGLVNNAGVGVTAPIELVPLEELRRQFEINVIGQVAVIQACLPLLRQARGRIINVGSVGGRVTIPFGGPLCASKYALESVNDALRMELRPWAIHVALIEPGTIRTPAAHKLGADSEAMLSTFSAEGRARYAGAYRAFVRTFLRQHEHGAGPEVMAEAVYRALTAHTPRPRYPVGPNARLLPFLAAWLPTRALDVLRTRRFHVFQTFGSAAEAPEPVAGSR